MRGEVEGTAIRLTSTMRPAVKPLRGAMDEDFADAFTRHEQNRARVKFARQFSRRIHREAYGSWGETGQFRCQPITYFRPRQVNSPCAAPNTSLAMADLSLLRRALALHWIVGEEVIGSSP